MSSGDDNVKVDVGPAAGGRRVLDVRRIEVIDDRMAAVLRAMGPERRVEAAINMFEMMVDLARSGARSAHPEWSSERIEIETRRRLRHDNS